MREYKVVHLNKKNHISRKKDLMEAEDEINKLISEGWELQQVISPNDLFGSIVGIFFKEKINDQG